MPFFLLTARIVVYSAFAVLMIFLFRRKRSFDLFVVASGGVFVLSGELVNLYVSQMAVYADCDGFPVYIVLSGAMIVWALFRCGEFVERKFGMRCFPLGIFAVFALSFLLPLVELFGLETGLWRWRRSYPLFSMLWYSGVWKYYFIFIALPAIIAASIRHLTRRAKRH
ncbi:MAG: hypothetical protein KAG97_01085 [Victivallales bacterium]|nr:hypothetical protein [Victivallales bacterium]